MSQWPSGGLPATPGGVASVAEISVRPGNLHLPANSRFANPESPQRPLPASRQAAFLDRDGVLIEDVGFLNAPEQLHILDGVPAAIRSLQQQFYIVVITNQSGIARGYFNEDDLLNVHRHLTGRLEQQGAFLDALYFCPHFPDGSIRSYAITCDCRKPQPGMLLRSQREWGLELTGSHMVGDQPTDVEAGNNAGATGILLKNGGLHGPGDPLSAPDLAAAAALMLAHGSLSETKPECGEEHD